MRRRKRRTYADPIDFEATAGHVPASETGPVELCSRAEETRQPAEALATLEPADRALLTLRFDEALTFQEIADVVDRPLSTVKSQVERAIARLRIALGCSKNESTRNSDK